jgi:FMN phosphatase YigB (HAD superfamily)
MDTRARFKRNVLGIYMMPKTLLLDVDGVLIRDSGLLAHVRHNCERYVKAKIPDCKDPRYVNHILYKTHGHTARGLSQSFGVDTRDFNKSVYDVPLKTRLWELLSSTEFQQDAKELCDVMDNGWNVTLFTNSPMEWAGEVAHAIGRKVHIACPPDDLADAPLKPEARAYVRFPKHHKYVFVDDSLKNLRTASYLPNWQVVHYDESKSSGLYPTVGSIWELGLFVNSQSLL